MGPSVRPATSPTKGSATRTGSRHDVTCEGRERLEDEDNGSAHARMLTNVEQQPITSAEVLTVCQGEPTKYQVSGILILPDQYLAGYSARVRCREV